MNNGDAETRNLEKITLSGYKSIRGAELALGPVNILIGANGSGKSNFISVFSLFNALAQGKLQSWVKRNGGAERLLHFSSRTTDSAVIDLAFADDGYHVELKKEINDNTVFVDSEFYRPGPSARPPLVLHGKNGESGLCGGDAVAEPVRRYLENCRVYHFNDTGDSAGFKQSPFLTDTAYFYRDGKNLAAFLYMLKTRFPGNYGSIVDSVQTIAPFFHDFFLVPDGTNGDRTILLRWLNKTGEEPFSAQQLSDGTARFICMATLFLQPPHLLPPLVVLDEPELGLHPAAMTVLADIIKSAAKHTRILCTTQSVTFANEFGPECFIVVDQKDGVSTFSRPDSAALDIWLDDYAMGDIWNKSLIGGQPAW